MSNSENVWKDKYLKSLSDLEDKEKQWGNIEFSLRKCISRLSFIGDGRDTALDEKLESLRNRVRGEQDINRLLDMIEGITRLFDSLPSEKNTTQLLQVLSEKLTATLQTPPFPGSMKGQIRGLAKRLKKEEMSAELLGEFVGLVKEGLSQSSSADSSEQGGGGLFGKLFNKSSSPEASASAETTVEKAPEIPQPSIAPEQPREERATASPVRTTELHELTREVLANLVRKLDAVGGWSQPLLPFLGRIDQATTGAALVDLSTDLTRVLSPSQKQVIPADEALLQLLEMLDFSTESGSQINEIRTALLRGLSERSLPNVLEKIAALVGQLREKAESERQEVEKFLLQLTDQLQALDSELLGVDKQGGDMIASNISFGESVQGDMSDLQAHVVAATDLDELKLTISERIALIEERLRLHRQEEESREEQFKQDIGGLQIKLAEVEKETTALKQTVIEARKKAFKDALTGLNNRHAFDTRLDEEFSRWSRYGHPMSLIIIDIDDFKKVNDTYGHKAGDKVLKVVGQHLSQQVRKADFPARYGGEEFVVLLPEVPIDSAWQVAEKIRGAISQKGFHSGGVSVTITVSAGVAEFKQGDTTESVFNRADAALYHAKGTGKNRSCKEGEVDE